MPPYDSPSYPESPPNASSSDSPFNASRKDLVSTAKLLLSPVHWTLGEIVITWINKKKMNQSGILLLIRDAIDDGGDGGCLMVTVDVMVTRRWFQSPPASLAKTRFVKRDENDFNAQCDYQLKNELVASSLTPKTRGKFKFKS